MKTSPILAILAGALMLCGCSATSEVTSADDASKTAVFEIEGHRIFLRGEMNDYAVLSSYELTRFEEDSYCTLAPLRKDWAPYRFKFADAAWSSGASFGFKQAPGIIREGSTPIALNRFSRFEELKYYPSEDGVYRFCILEVDGEFYARVTRAEERELSFMEHLLGSFENQGE